MGERLNLKSQIDLINPPRAKALGRLIIAHLQSSIYRSFISQRFRHLQAYCPAGWNNGCQRSEEQADGNGDQDDSQARALEVIPCLLLHPDNFNRAK